MVCRSTYYNLRGIGKIRTYLDVSTAQITIHALVTPKIRTYLDVSTAQITIHALVTPKLDYLNGLLHGLPACQLAKLRRVQNTAARIVSRVPRRCHITPVLHKLHWLPIKYLVQLKVLVLTYKAVHNKGPSYIKDMLVHHNPRRTLRSESKLLLDVPMSRTHLEDRAFSVAAPTLWNNIPLGIRQAPSTDAFKRLLQAYLFCQAF